MNSFELASSVEKEGLAHILPYIEQYHPAVQLVMTCPHLYLQKWIGDFLYKKGPRVYAVELKVERKATGNLFLERDSNFGYTQGWLLTTQADWLWYYFLESHELYHANMKALRQWAFGQGPNNANVLQFPEKPQRQYKQKNHTRGWCVPIHILQRAINLRGPEDITNPQVSAEVDDGEWFANHTVGHQMTQK